LNASGRAGSNVEAAGLRVDELGEIPRDHPLCVTVPGCVDGFEALSSELGTMSLAECLAWAIGHATEGFPASPEQAAAFRAARGMYLGHPAVEGLYPDGRPVEPGDVVRRPDLARTLEAIAADGRDAFYRGLPGDDIVEELGGTITHEDLARQHAEWVDPISARVSGLSAWTIPPNSQGYLGPAALAVFEMLEPPADADDPVWWHLMIESYRAVAWERNDLVADPGHAPLPPELLLDSSRLERAAATVDPTRAGTWPAGMGRASGTAYLCVVDGGGMAVSMIQSNYHGTGSAFGARRSGFLLHNRGAGFTLTQGHPNELLPGKRPLHTLSPTLWTSDRLPRWVIGTRGGSVQPQLVAQVAARAILAGHDLEAAQAAPRWTIEEFGPYTESRLRVEPGIAPATVDRLAGMGHRLDVLGAHQRGWGPVSVIEVDGPVLKTARDPRVETTEAEVVSGK
jgi:gamma-glutamyltranspeptidase/glutathione hydrolase